MTQNEHILEEEIQWLIESDDAGTRIDKFLSVVMGDTASRSQIQQWLKDDHIMVNDKTVKANYKTVQGDEIVLKIPEPVAIELIPDNIPLQVVYEDNDVIVVNKPRGMVVHP